MVSVKSLPDYLVADVDNLEAVENSPLRQKAKPLEFPLTEEDIKDINTLVLKYDNEVKILGLAAPQIGISKRVFVFAIPGIYVGQRIFPKTILINPLYEKINDEVEEEYEECFSVKDLTGPVERYKSVYYKAYNMEGDLMRGVVHGIPARVIQHETDHLDGKLFIDFVPREKLIPIEHLENLKKPFRETEPQQLKDEITNTQS